MSYLFRFVKRYRKWWQISIWTIFWQIVPMCIYLVTLKVKDPLKDIISEGPSVSRDYIYSEKSWLSPEFWFIRKVIYFIGSVIPFYFYVFVRSNFITTLMGPYYMYSKRKDPSHHSWHTDFIHEPEYRILGAVNQIEILSRIYILGILFILN